MSGVWALRFPYCQRPQAALPARARPRVGGLPRAWMPLQVASEGRPRAAPREPRPWLTARQLPQQRPLHCKIVGIEAIDKTRSERKYKGKCHRCQITSNVCYRKILPSHVEDSVVVPRSLGKTRRTAGTPRAPPWCSWSRGRRRCHTLVPRTQDTSRRALG